MNKILERIDGSDLLIVTGFGVTLYGLFEVHWALVPVAVGIALMRIGISRG